jgi:excisionase family DNA binding protein
METVMEKATLSIEAACAYLDISRPTLYRLMDSGNLKSFHIGRRRLCLKSDLDAFLEERLADAGYRSGQRD